MFSVRLGWLLWNHRYWFPLQSIPFIISGIYFQLNHLYLTDFSFSLKKLRHVPDSLLLAPFSWTLSSSGASTSRLVFHLQISPEPMVQFVQGWDLNSFGAVRCSPPIQCITPWVVSFLQFLLCPLQSKDGSSWQGSQWQLGKELCFFLMYVSITSWIPGSWLGPSLMFSWPWATPNSLKCYFQPFRDT